MGVLFKDYVSINFIVLLCIVGFSALLPDIDTVNSKVGRRVKPISKAIEKSFGHRGIMHSVWAAVFFAWLVSLVVAKDYALAFLIGYGSHLLIDGFTIMGINYFNPIFTLRLHGFIETKSAAEYLLLFVMSSFLLYFLV